MLQVPLSSTYYLKIDVIFLGHNKIYKCGKTFFSVFVHTYIIYVLLHITP